MAKGFRAVNENNEELARMVSEGFERADTQFENVNNKLDSFDDGQKQIKLRLDNVAYRFELTQVQRRVARLEKKTGIKYP